MLHPRKRRRAHHRGAGHSAGSQVRQEVRREQQRACPARPPESHAAHRDHGQEAEGAAGPVRRRGCCCRHCSRRSELRCGRAQQSGLPSWPVWQRRIGGWSSDYVSNRVHRTQRSYFKPPVCSFTRLYFFRASNTPSLLPFEKSFSAASYLSLVHSNATLSELSEGLQVSSYFVINR